jgi:hypothetical protein
MQNNDFREGIRAVLVDRDNKPQWNPATLDQVHADYIESYFQSLGEHELNVF